LSASRQSSCRANSACTAGFSTSFRRPRPTRCESSFFGDEVESIRRFDAATQRKIEDLAEVGVTVLGTPSDPQDAQTDVAANGAPVDDKIRGDDKIQCGDAHLVDWLPAGSQIVFVELAEMLDEGRHSWGGSITRAAFQSPKPPSKGASSFPPSPWRPFPRVGGDGLSPEDRVVERFDVPAAEVIRRAGQRFVGRDEQVLIACHNSGERERLTECWPKPLPNRGGSRSARGTCCAVFAVADRLIVLSDHELFRRRTFAAPRPQGSQGIGREPRHRQFSRAHRRGPRGAPDEGDRQYRGMQMLGEGTSRKSTCCSNFATE